jgi:hypothetical protein
MSGFQSQVLVQPAPGVAGDFCDSNPRSTVDAGPGGFVAGANGVTVGAFAWTQGYPIDANSAPTVVNNTGYGSVTGFVHREQQALITQYLGTFSMLVPTGFPVTLFNAGSFWVKNSGTTEATIGMNAYANFSNGLVTFAAASSPNVSASGTASSIAAGTASVTGSISGDVLTVTAVGSGTLVVGGTLSGTNVASGTMIVSQISGTAGGVGTYSVSIPEQTVASTTISETYGTLTVGGTVTGTFGVGDVLSGSGGGGVTAGTYITALGTGTGGAGTYICSPTQTVTSTTISAATNVQTKFIAASAGAPGELIKMTSHLFG